MPPIIIPFTPNDVGRVLFDAHISTSDNKSLKRVEFKLDYGSDFTTISCDDLESLGYSGEYLKSCPVHEGGASLAADELNVPLQYITNVSIKFGDRELQHCRIFFALDTGLRSLFGTDILKYFKGEICYDTGKITLSERSKKPGLLEGEKEIEIYSFEQSNFTRL